VSWGITMDRLRRSSGTRCERRQKSISISDDRWSRGALAATPESDDPADVDERPDVERLMHAEWARHAAPEVLVQGIKSSCQAVRDAEVALDVAVTVARAENVPWSVIGAAAGISRRPHSNDGAERLLEVQAGRPSEVIALAPWLLYLFRQPKPRLGAIGPCPVNLYFTIPRHERSSGFTWCRDCARSYSVSASTMGVSRSFSETNLSSNFDPLRLASRTGCR